MKMRKERTSIISVRNGFSDRHGIGSVANFLQIYDFDDRTRIIISNFVRDFFETIFVNNPQLGYQSKIGYNPEQDLFKELLSKVFCLQNTLGVGQRLDWVAVYDKLVYGAMREAPYNEVLDLIEFVAIWFFDCFIIDVGEIFCNSMNLLFEKERVGYRFVNRRIVEITDENEIKEIGQAARGPFNACRTHIEKAVGFLADREKQDYKNCIKESISAVEAICKIIGDDSKADLRKALKRLKDVGINIPPTLEAAWEKMYAYTCDEGGIRHAEKLFESDVTFQQAKYMLVSCSAFVNYLISEYEKIKNNERQ